MASPLSTLLRRSRVIFASVNNRHLKAYQYQYQYLDFQRRLFANDTETAVELVKKKRKSATRTDSSNDLSAYRGMRVSHFRALFQEPSKEHRKRYRRRWDWHLRHLILALTTPTIIYIYLTGVEYYMAHYATMEQLKAHSAAAAAKRNVSGNSSWWIRQDDANDQSKTTDATPKKDSNDSQSSPPLALEFLDRRLTRLEDELERYSEMRRKADEQYSLQLINQARSISRKMSRSEKSD